MTRESCESTILWRAISRSGASRRIRGLEPSKNILNDTGQADMAVSRGFEWRRISGGGGLFTVVFQAVGRGNTNVSVSSVSLKASTGQPISVTAPPPLVVNVK